MRTKNKALLEAARRIDRAAEPVQRPEPTLTLMRFYLSCEACRSEVTIDAEMDEAGRVAGDVTPIACNPFTYCGERHDPTVSTEAIEQAFIDGQRTAGVS